MYPLNPQLFLASYRWLSHASTESLLQGTPLEYELEDDEIFSVTMSEPCQLALWVLMKSLLSHTDSSWEGGDGLLGRMDQWHGDRPLPNLYVKKPPTAAREPNGDEILHYLKLSIDDVLRDARGTLVLSLETLGFRA